MLEESTGKPENHNVRNMRDYSFQLRTQVAESVEHRARREGKTVDQLLREVVTKIIEDQATPLETRLHKVRVLIREIAIAMRKTPLQEQKDARTGALVREERKKKRDHLVELGMEAYDELRKIASSEEAAKHAEFCMQAFLVMARLGSFSAAVIHDQETEDLEQLIAEVENKGQELDERLEKIEKKRREKEEEEKERWRTAAI